MTDSVYCQKSVQYYQNNKPVQKLTFNKAGLVVGQKIFSPQGVLLMRSELLDLDTVFVFDTLSLENDFPSRADGSTDPNLIIRDSILLYKNTFFRYYIKADTYYPNGNNRTTFISTRQGINSKSYSKYGKLLYENKVRINETGDRDTLSGVFKDDSYYNYINFNIYRKGEIMMKVKVPLYFTRNAINTGSVRELDCRSKFCVLEKSKSLSKRKERKYYSIINKAIDSDLITNLSNCFYQ
nr:hypothetical protein [uncultured Fluviicola sp.]